MNPILQLIFIQMELKDYRLSLLIVNEVLYSEHLIFNLSTFIASLFSSVAVKVIIVSNFHIS